MPEAKIDDTCAALPNLSGIAPPAAAAVAEAYRCMHGIVGIGPTVGFTATGRPADDVEDVLRSPYHDRRGLNRRRNLPPPKISPSKISPSKISLLPKSRHHGRADIARRRARAARPAHQPSA
ncbi:MAG: hypothetical protein ABSC37_09080 [Xanthobacteraceae bacterium]|jgi:hypothetical protein